MAANRLVSWYDVRSQAAFFRVQAGLMLAWWGRLRYRRGDLRASFMVKVGLENFTWWTLVNILVGLWYFMAQPPEVRKLALSWDTRDS